MSTDLAAEGPMGFSRIVREHPALKNVSLRTVARWALRGCRGVKLESIIVGGQRMTTLPAVDRFLAQLNGNASDASQAVRSPTERRRADAAADAELTAAGL